MTATSRAPEPEPGRRSGRRRRARIAGAVIDMVGYQENGERLTGSVEMGRWSCRWW